MYYLYDNKHHEYIGESTIRTENCTDIKPPEKGEHQALIWQSDKWNLVEDWRGTHVYSYNGCVELIINCFGPLPLNEGYTQIPPPPKRDGEKRNFDVKTKTWLCSLEEGWIYDNMIPRPMTEAERVKYGLDELPKGTKIEGDYIVPKTPYELYEDGEITIEEANQLIRELREYDYVTSTDKYGFMYMRGEVTMEEWQAEIQKVKDKYPFIEENNG